MLDYLIQLSTAVNLIDLDALQQAATAIGGVLTLLVGYAFKLLHTSAKDSKSAAEAMKVDFSDLNDEFKALMDNQATLQRNQEELIRLSYEIKGKVGARTLPTCRRQKR